MACVTPRQISNILTPLLSHPSSTGNKTSPGSLKSRDSLYRQLLSSYSTYDWCNKPLPLSPLQCAKWGWESAGKDTLQCKQCKAKIHFVCTFQPWQNTEYERLCKGFGIELQTSHLVVCPWAGRPVSEDVLLGGRSSLIYDKSDFVNTFFDLRKTFGTEKMPVIEVPGSALKKLWPVLNIILKSVKTGGCSKTSEELSLSIGNVTLLLLSLFGWRQSEDTLPTLHCKLCLRTLGRWNFRTLLSDTVMTVLDESPSGWNEDESYMLYSLDSTDRSRELSSASELSHSTPSSESVDHNSPEKDRSCDSTAGVSPDSEAVSPTDNYRPDVEMRDVSDRSTDGTSSNKHQQAGDTKAEEAVSTKGKEGSLKLDTNTCEEHEAIKVEDLEAAKSEEEPLKTDCICTVESTVNAKGESTNTKEESTETKVHSSFGNPDIFLPVASYVLYQPRPKSEDTKNTCEFVDNAAKAETGEVISDESSNDKSNSPKQFKTPLASNIAPSPSSTRILRSRSRTGEQSVPTPRARKRKCKTADSPPTPTTRTSTRRTRSGPAPSVTSPLQPRKRRRSKLQIAESLVSEVMKSSPTQLDLSSSNPTNLNVLKQHHYWCPWVCTLPSYHINKNVRSRLGDQDYKRVSVVDQSDTPGWETLLFHLTTVKSPGNAWIAVHNMLEDCVSQRM